MGHWSGNLDAVKNFQDARYGQFLYVSGKSVAAPIGGGSTKILDSARISKSLLDWDGKEYFLIRFMGEFANAGNDKGLRITIEPQSGIGAGLFQHSGTFSGPFDVTLRLWTTTTPGDFQSVWQLGYMEGALKFEHFPVVIGAVSIDLSLDHVISAWGMGVDAADDLTIHQFSVELVK